MYGAEMNYAIQRLGVHRVWRMRRKGTLAQQQRILMGLWLYRVIDVSTPPVESEHRVHWIANHSMHSTYFFPVRNLYMTSSELEKTAKSLVQRSKEYLYDTDESMTMSRRLEAVGVKANEETGDFTELRCFQPRLEEMYPSYSLMRL